MKGYQALPEECCGSCKYFRLHYIRQSEGFYSALNYGHCVYPRHSQSLPISLCPSTW